MSSREDVKVALALPLGAAKLGLNKNKPVEACKAMKVFNAGVALFLSKGKLTASQGRQLNTASKDIRAPRFHEPPGRQRVRSGATAWVART